MAIIFRIGNIAANIPNFHCLLLLLFFCFFFTECIRVKYGEILERRWSEIRPAMNQKCLDKLKQRRHLNPV